jgi:hypothetical protein
MRNRSSIPRAEALGGSTAVQDRAFVRFRGSDRDLRPPAYSYVRDLSSREHTQRSRMYQRA